MAVVGLFRRVANTTSASPNIVVAPKFMNELKRLPDDVLSFNKAIEEVGFRKEA